MPQVIQGSLQTLCNLITIWLIDLLAIPSKLFSMDIKYLFLTVSYDKLQFNNLDSIRYLPSINVSLEFLL
jgi:hypothetical protein